MTGRASFSRPLTVLAAVLVGLSTASDALRAESAKTTQDQGDVVFVAMTMVEVPAELAQKFAIAERLAELGFVLSDAEAKKLIESGQSASGCNVVHVPRVQTAVGRSALLVGSIGDRRGACLVLPESAASNGEIRLRVALVPASRSAAELAAGDHATLFSLTRASATAELRKDESMMLGGWKTGKDNGRTLLLIVKPQFATEQLAKAKSPKQSHSNMVGMVVPRTIVPEKEERLGAVREVSTAEKPAAAAASARPSTPSPLPRPPAPQR